MIETSSSEKSLEPADEIAELLVGEEAEAEPEAPEVPEEDTDDNEGDEGQTEESNEKVDESEDDKSWESVLGVEDGQLAYSEDGDMTGVNVKVNGESSTVEMQDLIAGYQNNKTFTQKSQVLAEERKTFDAQVGQLAEVYKTKLANADNLASFLEKKIVQEFDNVNWEQLRAENPAEYAAARADFSARASELQQYQQGLQEEMGQQDQQSQEQQQQHHQHNLQGQFDKMINNNPTWNNKETLQKDMLGLRTFMGNQYGFDDNDFNSVTDARVIELMKDAKAYREGQKIGKAKRNKPVPKFQKSSGRPAKSKTTKLDKLTNAAKTAKGDNKRVAQRDAIAELLTGQI